MATLRHNLYCITTCTLLIFLFGLDTMSANSTVEENFTTVPSRSGRKSNNGGDYAEGEVVYYPELGETIYQPVKYGESGEHRRFLWSPKSQEVPRAKGSKFYLPLDTNLKESGSETQWTIVKVESDSGEKQLKMKKGPSPVHSDDPWLTEAMNLWMFQNSMKDTNALTNKPSGLSRLFDDPMVLFLAAAIPLALIMAAVVPVLIKFMMQGNNIPIITTAATGNRTFSSRKGDNLEDIMPILEAIGNLGVRSLHNPECFQKFLCQATTGSSKNSTMSMTFQKLVNRASYIVKDSWLEAMGLKQFVASIREGNCDHMLCNRSKYDVYMITDELQKKQKPIS